MLLDGRAVTTALLLIQRHLLKVGCWSRSKVWGTWGDGQVKVGSLFTDPPHHHGNGVGCQGSSVLGASFTLGLCCRSCAETLQGYDPASSNKKKQFLTKPKHVSFFSPHPRTHLLILEREEGREGERERNIDRLPVVLTATGDLAHNPGMYPDWESNLWLLGLQDDPPTTQATQTRAHSTCFSSRYCFTEKDNLIRKTFFFKIPGKTPLLLLPVGQYDFRPMSVVFVDNLVLNFWDISTGSRARRRGRMFNNSMWQTYCLPASVSTGREFPIPDRGKLRVIKNETHAGCSFFSHCSSPTLGLIHSKSPLCLWATPEASTFFFPLNWHLFLETFVCRPWCFLLHHLN